MNMICEAMNLTCEAMNFICETTSPVTEIYSLLLKNRQCHVINSAPPPSTPKTAVHSATLTLHIRPHPFPPHTLFLHPFPLHIRPHPFPSHTLFLHSFPIHIRPHPFPPHTLFLHSFPLHIRPHLCLSCRACSVPSSASSNTSSPGTRDHDSAISRTADV